MSIRVAHRIFSTIGLAAVLLLAGCGGGGSSEGEPQPSPGSLDPSFGNGGTVTASRVSVGYSVALQHDGKILVAGGEWLTRYDRDGILDTSFGTGGFAVAAPGGVIFSAVRILLQPDNKIVASGDQTGGGGDYHCALARYTAEGAIDRSFGDGGLVVWQPDGSISSCTAIAIGADGDILVGIHFGPYAIASDLTAKFHADGKLDTTFGDNGTASVGGVAAIQPDGKILAVTLFYGHGRDQCTVARLDPRGAQDGAFGDGGYLNWTRPFDESAPLSCALALQPDGKFVVLNQGSAARFLENGAPDSRFGGGVTTGVPGSALAVQSNGKIVVGGRDEMGRLALWRLDADGQHDSGFGNAGTVVTPLLGAGGADGLAIQPDGRIIASGWTEDPGEEPLDSHAVLIRYFGD